uniref:L domain-like protein n=1 Tax=Pseudictyota dubia TaxID=2749911 RepID=A0A7R9W7P3_9STRA|mmetsp:Transcript_37341/g.69075  ORF Transcript_37341/g.69075 Transcript_37341/m.69075 type:complete len:869 (+) Transcript_37341:342-2948(+)
MSSDDNASADTQRTSVDNDATPAENEAAPVAPASAPSLNDDNELEVSKLDPDRNDVPKRAVVKPLADHIVKREPKVPESVTPFPTHSQATNLPFLSQKDVESNKHDVGYKNERITSREPTIAHLPNEKLEVPETSVYRPHPVLTKDGIHSDRQHHISVGASAPFRRSGPEMTIAPLPPSRMTSSNENNHRTYNPQVCAPSVTGPEIPVAPPPPPNRLPQIESFRPRMPNIDLDALASMIREGRRRIDGSSVPPPVDRVESGSEEPSFSERREGTQADESSLTAFSATLVSNNGSGEMMRATWRLMPQTWNQQMQPVLEGTPIPEDQRGKTPGNLCEKHKLKFALSILGFACAVCAVVTPIVITQNSSVTSTDPGESDTPPVFPTDFEVITIPGKNMSTLSPTDSVVPTQSPTSYRYAVIKSVLSHQMEKLPSSGPEMLENDDLPQYEAFEWLVGEDKMEIDLSNEEGIVQRFVLATLCFATGGNASSLTSMSFLSPSHECDWGGVGCNEDQLTVVTLSLDNMYLNSTIPQELGLLEHLAFMSLRWSELYGIVPKSLGELKKLRHLDLSENKLDGTIPAELEGLSSLEILRLNSNFLNGTIPFTGRGLASISEIDLCCNSLSGTIPPNFSTSDVLTILSLSRNSLEGHLPARLLNATHLKLLEVGDNLLTGSFPEIVRDTSPLRFLRAERNDFNGPLPASVGNLLNLEDLFLHMNRLSGTLPDSLTNLKKLSRLVLSRNRFSGSLPDIFGEMKSLWRLFLDANKFGGRLPPSFAQVDGLSIFSIANNSFSGGMEPVCERRCGSVFAIADCYGNQSDITCDCCQVCCTDQEVIDRSTLTTSDLGLDIFFGKGKLPGCFRMPWVPCPGELL